jgi:hypothetical protein
MASQAGLMENNQVIQALAVNRADHAFHISPLPGRARRSQDLFDPHRLDLLDEVLPKDPVAIA